MTSVDKRAVQGGTTPEAVCDAIAVLRAAADHPGEVTHLMVAPDLDPAPALARLPRDTRGIDVVLATSGSTTGEGRLVGLSAAALFASAHATLKRLGGPGQWLTSLPVHHVAGLQVLARSVVAGIDPVVWTRTGSESFRDAVRALRPGVPHYLSLVPTQLVRLLESDPGSLSGFDAVLVGGAALPRPLAIHAEAEGVRVVRTYGATETSGGCVYDGLPLDGVRVRLDGGRVLLAGPTLASGYLDGGPDPFAVDGEGKRWFVTSDLGEWREGRLHISGRADDVVISGGVKVSPQRVEEALQAALGGAWVAVGIDDPEWGQLVVAVTDGEWTLGQVRAACAGLQAAERPRALLAGTEIPRRGIGKVDRRAVERLVLQADAAGRLSRRA